MKPLFLAVAFLLVSSGAAGVSTPDENGGLKPAAPPTLVDTANANKARRKKSTTKVITNADVKRAKSKIVETKVPAAPVVREPTLMEKHVAAKAAKADTDAKRAATEELIGELEIELATLEQRYYEENDLNRRDTEIVKRFNDVKKRLDEAKAALATLP